MNSVQIYCFPFWFVTVEQKKHFRYVEDWYNASVSNIHYYWQ
jgi:hypothetical protein